ncbi:hypothetical protein HY990_03825 [Candidatus Micrarchaeota archaeon]|nr:hypothetical protein [Candidatus Micrarchaeota archaeon]
MSRQRERKDARMQVATERMRRIVEKYAVSPEIIRGSHTRLREKLGAKTLKLDALLPFELRTLENTLAQYRREPEFRKGFLLKAVDRFPWIPRDREIVDLPDPTVSEAKERLSRPDANGTLGLVEELVLRQIVRENFAEAQFNFGLGFSTIFNAKEFRRLADVCVAEALIFGDFKEDRLRIPDEFGELKGAARKIAESVDRLGSGKSSLDLVDTHTDPRSICSLACLYLELSKER